RVPEAGTTRVLGVGRALGTHRAVARPLNAECPPDAKHARGARLRNPRRRDPAFTARGTSFIRARR
ncbi:MAG: hypothetical protein AAFQ35_11975, partial [Pseudomonadota bacterium]